MHQFWDTIIEPVLLRLQPESLIEIGADEGKNTANLLDFCKQTDAVLHSVDPLPGFDVAAWQSQYGKLFIFHQTLSLNAIPEIDRFDVVLIDGDHNWYTVFNELILIEKQCKKLKQPFPIVILHDIGWPYGRRDLYYNPENIPDTFRKPFKRQGMWYGSAELLENGGLNPHLDNSIYENDLRNGVLTAVEDYMNETMEPLELINIPGLYGLGILFPKSIQENNKALFEFFEAISISTVAKQYFDRLEGARIQANLLLQERNTSFSNLEDKYRQEVEKSQVVQDKQGAEIKNRNDKIKELRNEINKLGVEIEARDRQTEELKKEIKKSNAEVDAWIEELENLESRLKERELEINKKNDETQALEDCLQLQNDKIEELHNGLNKLGAEIEARDKKTEGLEREIGNRNTEIKNRDSEIKILECRLKEIESGINKKNDEINLLQDQIQDSSSKLSSRDTNIEKLQIDLDKQKTAIEAFRNELAIAKGANEQIEKLAKGEIERALVITPTRELAEQVNKTEQ